MESEGRKSFFMVLLNALHREGKPSALIFPLLSEQIIIRKSMQQMFIVGCFRVQDRVVINADFFPISNFLEIIFTLLYERLFHSVPLQISHAER